MTAQTAPPAPAPRLCVGVTGHRLNNAALRENEQKIRAELAALFARLAAQAAAAAPHGQGVRLRLHTMLADGADQFCVDAARGQNWEIVAPLPFGAALTAAASVDVARDEEADLLRYAKACAAGESAGVEIAASARAAVNAFFAYARDAHLMQLSDRDALIEDLYLKRAHGDVDAQFGFVAESSHRYTLASRIIVEQSDLIIAIWDGASKTLFGGTGHTIASALENGVPVLWLDPTAPHNWRLLRTPENLNAAPPAQHADLAAALMRIVSEAVSPLQQAPQNLLEAESGLESFLGEVWKPSSNPLWHAYRRVEAVFSGDRPLRNLRQHYATPVNIAETAWRDFLQRIAALPGLPAAFAASLKAHVAERFAWADGLSTHLSDAYRGGMILNFALSAFAAIGGLTYMPFFSYGQKWGFAVFELAMLCAIVLITWIGGKRRWHARWFEMRRVAEYLRHAPILLAIGVARAVGRWPRGVETSWPEWYARQSLREVGLPRAAITRDYLRTALENVLRPHAASQRDYHVIKAKRLHHVHDNLDKLSTALFICAIVVVAGYVFMQAYEWVPSAPHFLTPQGVRVFTYFGVALPLLGATIAGVRYFGDFERFSAISEVAAEKLDAITARIDLLLTQDDADIDYDAVSRLAHAIDDVVVAEIESWQAVFGGKHITIPV